MPNNRISPDFLSTAGDVLRRIDVSRPSLAARVTARLRAYQFDRQLAVGVPAPAGSALAVHQSRLTSVAEREAIARTLRQAVNDAQPSTVAMSSRLAIHPKNVAAAQDLIDTITLRLHS